MCMNDSMENRTPERRQHRAEATGAAALAVISLLATSCESDRTAEAKLATAVQAQAKEVALAGITRRPIDVMAPEVHLTKGEFSRSDRGPTMDMQIDNRRPVSLPIPTTEGGPILLPGGPKMPIIVVPRSPTETPKLATITIDSNFNPEKEKTLRIGFTHLAKAATAATGVHLWAQWAKDNSGKHGHAWHLQATFDRSRMGEDAHIIVQVRAK
jgi:hypothetical protein